MAVRSEQERADGQAPGNRGARGAVRRTWSLSRAELRLLLRNRTAMLVALALPVATVVLLHTVEADQGPHTGAGAATVIMFVGVALLYVVYYNLVSTYVARREDLVLKRMRVGELADAEILAGMAVPSVVLTIAQIVLVSAGVALWSDLTAPVNAVVVAVAVLGGTVLFTLLAAATTKITRNVEMAQMSTLPLFLVCLGLSGLVVPVDVFGERLATAAQFLPLTPVVDLVRLGLVGTTGDAAPVGFTEVFQEAAMPGLILAAWLLLGVELTRRWFRWEPRR